MARFAYLILLIALVSSCAEVGTISGGPEDEFAPRPIEDRCDPPNQSVNFKGQEIELVFDEFFKLNDPANNIRMVPPHAQISAQMKGKSLFLRWEEPLEPNVTYAIYLNNAVSDITENNDTIIQYVFSTGASLDSLFYEVAVADAWTGNPVSGCTVGLYDPENGEIQSFAETNKYGLARLSYLRPGTYQLLAFADENKDLVLQTDEALAFPLSESIQVAPGYLFDSLPIRMYTPESSPKLRTKRPEFPGVLTLAAKNGLSGAKIFTGGTEVNAEDFRWLGEDSLLLPIDLRDKDFLEVVVQSPLITDTLRIRANKNDRAKRVNLHPAKTNGVFSPSDSIALWCNDWIVGVDTSKITLRSANDSSLIAYRVSFSHNELRFHIQDRNDLEKVLVNLQPGAVTGRQGENTQGVFQFTFQQARKYGTLILDLSAYDQRLILQLLKEGKTVREIPVSDPSSPIRAGFLEPGDYTFVLVRDANGNGKWDVGDYVSRVQPELVDRYSEVVKVRANWEVESILIPQSAP